jgi:acetyltransferase
MTRRPYPKELEETFTLQSGREVLLRPIRPDDEPEHVELLHKLAPEDIRFRFFGSVRNLSHETMTHFTQIDYDRDMAFIASADRTDGEGHETLGVVRIAAESDFSQAEFAVLVRSDIKGQGLGWKLLTKIIGYCRDRGIGRIVGQVLPENRAMVDMAKELGFRTQLLPGEGVVEVSLDL